MEWQLCAADAQVHREWLEELVKAKRPDWRDSQHCSICDEGFSLFNRQVYLGWCACVVRIGGRSTIVGVVGRCAVARALCISRSARIMVAASNDRCGAAVTWPRVSAACSGLPSVCR